MKKCPFCSAEILDEADFCLYCMRPLTEKTIIKRQGKKSYTIAIITVVLLLILLCSLILVLTKPSSVAENPSNPLPISSVLVSASSYTSEDTIFYEDTSATGKTENQNSSSDNSLPIIYTQSSQIYNSEVSKENYTSKESTSNAESSDPTTSTTSSETSSEVESDTIIWQTNFVDGGVEITGIDNDNGTCEYTIPSQIDGNIVVGIADGAFKDTAIKKLTLPSTIKYIGEQSFSGCYELTNITIPENVTSVRNSAFANCKKLSKIYIVSTNINIHTAAFSTQYQRDVPLTIYAASSVMNSITARLQWDAEYEEWNG